MLAGRRRYPPPLWSQFSPFPSHLPANPANPRYPDRFFDVPNYSKLFFFRFFIDFTAPQTPGINEKPRKNLGFSMVFMNSANSLQNRQNTASGCPGTLKMEAFGTQNGTSGQQHEPPELQIEAQERPDGSSERQNGCPAGPWRLNLLLSMILTTVFAAPGNLQERFWMARGPYFGGFEVHRALSFPASGLHF